MMQPRCAGRQARCGDCWIWACPSGDRPWKIWKAPRSYQGALMSTSTWIIIGVVVVFVLWIIMVYNGLVAMRQRVNQAFADIDVQMKRRHDLIPNLVETVKGYASHESTVFQKVTEARAAAVAAGA